LTERGILNGEERTPVLLEAFGVQFYSDLIAHDIDFTVELNMPPCPANIWTFPDALPAR